MKTLLVVLLVALAAYALLLGAAAKRGDRMIDDLHEEMDEPLERREL